MSENVTSTASSERTAKLDNVSNCTELNKPMEKYLFHYAQKIDFGGTVVESITPTVIEYVKATEGTAKHTDFVGHFAAAYAMQNTDGVIARIPKTVTFSLTKEDRIYLEFKSLLHCSEYNTILTSFAAWVHMHPEFISGMSSASEAAAQLKLAIVGIPRRSILVICKKLKNGEISASLRSHFERIEELMVKLKYRPTHGFEKEQKNKIDKQKALVKKEEGGNEAAQGASDKSATDSSEI